MLIDANSYSTPLINTLLSIGLAWEADTLYPDPLFKTVKCEIVFSLAILLELPSSSMIVSPGLNSPERVFTNKVLFAE